MFCDKDVRAAQRETPTERHFSQGVPLLNSEIPFIQIIPRKKLYIMSYKKEAGGLGHALTKEEERKWKKLMRSEFLR